MYNSIRFKINCSNIYDPCHGKMCLWDKFGHFWILWFLNTSKLILV